MLSSDLEIASALTRLAVRRCEEGVERADVPPSVTIGGDMRSGMGADMCVEV